MTRLNEDIIFSNMQKSLHSLYTDFRAKLVENKVLFPDASAPYLLNPKPEYAHADFRVLFYGQEPLGWNWSKENCKEYPAYGTWPYSDICSYDDFLTHSDSVDALMEGYKRFDNATHQPRNRNSPFNRAFRQVKEICGPGIMVSNVCKMSYQSDSGTSYLKSPEPLRKKFDPYQNKLRIDEINILSPNAIMFFTSSKYDDLIWSGVPELSLVPAKDGENECRIGKFISPYLPCPIYRTYHPTYLQRSGKWEWIRYICDLAMTARNF
ncbi:hypothetical protein [Komagataeibacter melaceti]|uniref:hypothetical protein n=1 Tax=Komagataeibacter melaceti TaxID=2766577 RepID=UPI0011E5B873|nr:hypothetical protein [Komagataeibacter melaceti]